MKFPALLIAFFTLFSCSGQSKKASSKLHTEVVLTQLEPTQIYDSVLNTKRTVWTKKYLVQQLEPKITIEAKENNHLSYSLQGNISSGGLSIHRVKKIRTEKVINDKTLIIKHFVEIKRIPGKEGANVSGYNYTKNESLKIPKDVQHVKIELIEQYIDQPKKLDKSIANTIVEI